MSKQKKDAVKDQPDVPVKDTPAPVKATEKGKLERIAWDKLVLNYGFGADNARAANNLDTESMVPQLLLSGQVDDALSVEPIPDGRFRVLRGNRRLSGVQAIMKGAYTPEQKKGFETIECKVFPSLTDKEREDMIFDHGRTKPLSREETVLACWRLYKQGHSWQQIGDRLYSQLARYSGNEKKLGALPKDPVERQKKLDSWFRGTLDQDILYGLQMGPFIQQQYLLTRRREDGRLRPADEAAGTPAEKVTLSCDKEAIKKLWAARTADIPEKGGKGWTPLRSRTVTPSSVEGEPPTVEYDGGGENFNKEVEQQIAITQGKAEREKAGGRPSKDRVEKMKGSYSNPAITATLDWVNGDDAAAQRMYDYDNRLNRLDAALAVLAKAAPKIKDEGVKELINSILGDGPSADVEAAIAPYVK
jgi:hypothetical protein